ASDQRPETRSGAHCAAVAFPIAISGKRGSRDPAGFLAAYRVEGRFDQVRRPGSIERRQKVEGGLRRTCYRPPAIDKLWVDQCATEHSVDDDRATVEPAATKRPSVEVDLRVGKGLIIGYHLPFLLHRKPATRGKTGEPAGFGVIGGF